MDSFLAGRLAAVVRTSLVLAPLVLHAGAMAQALPDAGSLTREDKREPAPPPPSSTRLVPAPRPASAPAGGTRFVVHQFRLEGVTLVPEAELQAVLAPWRDRTLTFADLQLAEQALADAYRRAGWMARPELPAQDVVDGVVRLRMVEARLGQVRIDADTAALRFDSQRLTQALQARQQPGQPLRPGDLERAVNILNDTPGLRTAAVLAPGRDPGDTDVVLKPVDQPLTATSVQLDNSAPRATGSTRMAVDLALNDPLGIGDQALLAGSSTGGTNDFVSAGYSVPVGRDGLRAGVDASAMSYRLESAFAPLGAHGTSKTLGAWLAYPLLRAGASNVALRLSAEHDEFRNVAAGAVVSDKRLDGATAGLNGDDQRGDGSTSWGIAANVGRVDLTGNAVNQAADQAGPRTAGYYARLNWNLGRLQALPQAGLLWIAANGQVADKNLDSSAKFSLGGVDGVRAYPALEGTGDNGWLASAEWRYNLRPELQGLAFYDEGQVKVDQDASYAGASVLQRITLKGAGLGLNWSPADRYSVHVAVAHRLGSNPLADATTGKDSDGSLRRTRLWLSVRATF